MFPLEFRRYSMLNPYALASEQIPPALRCRVGLGDSQGASTAQELLLPPEAASRALGSIPLRPATQSSSVSHSSRILATRASVNRQTTPMTVSRQSQCLHELQSRNFALYGAA